MRVVDLTTLFLDGSESGVNTYLNEKARDFSSRQDVEHTLIVPGRRTEWRKLFDSDLRTIRSPRLPSNPEHRVIASMGEVRRLLLELEPTVVEVDCAHLLGKVAAKALAGKNVPIVGFYHVHLPTFIARPSASRLSSRLATAAEHYAWRYVDYCSQYFDRLVVASSDMEARLRERGYKGLECVPLGVNLELFRPRAERERAGPITILYVGRLSLEKKIEVVIEAFKSLSKRGDYQLQIVGDGPYRRRLERLARGVPGIEFEGSVSYGEELARIYARADILACPSPNETFSLTVLEGFAAGLPAVAIDRGGPRDLVTAEVGALAKPDDPEDFAAKLEYVAANLESLSSACRRHVEEHYSWRQTFTKLLGVYEDACRERAGTTGKP